MPSNNEHQSKSLVQLGAGLAIFGLVCPWFWLSLFSGNSPSDTWVYGLHSGFFIILGLILLGKGWLDLKSTRASKGINKSDPGQ